jgi:dienelactone hydrolase
VVDFGRRLVAAGFTVWLPSLFGTPGREFTRRATLGPMLRACISREVSLFATGRTSPIVAWLRRLAALAHAECGGPGVGAVGMCFTGNFALGMAVDERMLAPVLSQPALPVPVDERHRAALGITPADLDAVRARDGLCVLGLRFTEDPAVRPERFATLRRELGDRFIAVEIDSSEGNPHGIPKDAHSVLTLHFTDEPGHPTRDALDTLVTFCRDRLLPAG